MNPSEDPTDRLLDSLLREQARGKADDELLRAIEAKLGNAAPARRRNRRSHAGLWITAAAAVVVAGLGAVTWRSSRPGAADKLRVVAETREEAPVPATAPETGQPVAHRGTEPDHFVWEENDSAVASMDANPAESTPLSGDSAVPTAEISRDGTGVAGVPEDLAGLSGVVGDEARFPRPPRQRVLPPAPGSALADSFGEFAGRDRTVATGEGIRLRGLSFPADPALTEVYAHDPAAPPGTRGLRIEVKSHLDFAGQRLALKGDRLLLSSHREQPGTGTSTFGEVQIPREATDGILLVSPGETGRRVEFLDASPREFPPGSVLILNLSPAHVRFQLENDLHGFAAGERKLIPVLPAGPQGNTAIRAFYLHQGAWRRIATSVWPAPGAFRMLQIVWENPASQSIEIRGTRDRAMPARQPIGDGADPIGGLVFLRQEATMWYVQFGLESGGKWAPRFVGLTPDKKKLQNRVSAVELLSPGDIFFKEGPMAGRFKFLRIEEREIRLRPGLLERVKFGIYEDLSPGKAGTRYESQARLPDAELGAKAYYDRTAVLKFGELEFRVEQHAKFTLPGEDKRLEYVLKEVSAERVVIESEGADGEVITREIPKTEP